MSVKSPTSRELDELLSSPFLIEDPAAVYAEIRRAAPVYWSETRAEWLVTTHEHVVEALKTPETFVNRAHEWARYEAYPADVRRLTPAIRKTLSMSHIATSDPPLHTRLRRQVNRSFTPGAVAASTDWLRHTANGLLDIIAGKPSVDFAQTFNHELPMRAIIGLFGGDVHDVDLYRRLSTTRMRFNGMQSFDRNRVLEYEASLAAFRAYLDELWRRERETRSGSVLSSLLEGGSDNDRLSDDELFQMCLVFLSAGHETTAGLLDTLVEAFIENPELYDRIRDDRGNIRNAIEEALRLGTPSQRTIRTAARDVVLGEALIKEGDTVVLLSGAANRDPLRFPHPDRFDIDRADNTGHVAFGHGIHFCVGAGLARLEAGISIELWLERIRRFEAATVSKPRWAPLINLRLRETLPVNLVWG